MQPSDDPGSAGREDPVLGSLVIFGFSSLATELDSCHFRTQIPSMEEAEPEAFLFLPLFTELPREAV